MAASSIYHLRHQNNYVSSAHYSEYFLKAEDDMIFFPSALMIQDSYWNDASFLNISCLSHRYYYNKSFAIISRRAQRPSIWCHFSLSLIHHYFLAYLRPSDMPRRRTIYLSLLSYNLIIITAADDAIFLAALINVISNVVICCKVTTIRRCFKCRRLYLHRARGRPH